MSTNILNENAVSFKELEQAIFEQCCEAARESTKAILQAMDEKLAKERDKSKYRDKGYRKTTIKTIYGEVEYLRHVYITRTDDGRNAAVYLLDEELGIDTIGLISTNLAEKIGMVVTCTPFRKTSEQITETTGQSISHAGVWNVVQALGSKLEEEEKELVNEFYTERTRGTKKAGVLFEEMDGIWLKDQRNGGRKGKGLEVKIGTIYEGWKADSGKRSILSGKTVLAGIGSSEEFREKWEAKIQSIYDPSKIEQRILNGDGGDWIKDEYDADTIRQLDRFHVKKTIIEKVPYADARSRMLDLLGRNRSEELVEYVQIYYDSIDPEDEEVRQDAKELRDYLWNHEDELTNYKARDKEIPEAPKGIVYKNMGVQENQNCTVIGLRMKGKRKRWAPESANNMIRLLYYRENHDLIDAIDRYTDGEVMIEPVMNRMKMPLSAAKVNVTNCKGRNKYVEILNIHLPITDSGNTRTANVFRRLTY
jgi:hypothetical protein